MKPVGEKLVGLRDLWTSKCYVAISTVLKPLLKRQKMAYIQPTKIKQVYAYQQDGINFLASRERCGLHDSMGLGKTAQVVRAADAIQANRGIMVVPAKLRRNTVAQFHQWATRAYRITEGRSLADFLAWQKGRYHILVTSYEQATKWAASIYATGEPIDFVAMDEAHYTKNAEAHRTRAILGANFDGSGGLINWAEHVWHVSGTPMANDPMDIYTFLKLCGATTLPMQTFTKRYFYSDQSAYGSRQSVKPEAHAELMTLIEGNRVRRTLADVGFQLPHIQLNQVIVDGDTKPIVDLLKQYPTLSQAIVNAVQSGGISFLEAQHIMTMRRLLGEAKAPAYAHMLLDDLRITGNEKHVVMGIHVDALTFIYNFLRKRGVNAVLVNGTVTDRQADRNIRQFQDDPTCTVFLGNIKSAGLGSDLFAAARLDMLEQDWTPAGNAQAIKRIHRLGQMRPCFVRFVSLARTFDETVNRIVIQKTSAIADIEGDAMPAHV
jgi:SWI/SNF-related matrix-associated actin-dependent regulator 1 of chromatin subfamily A